MHDHRVDLVEVAAWVQAVALQVDHRSHFHVRVVFAEVVVEAFESQDEDGRRVLDVELSYCLLGLAAFAGEVVVLAEVLRSEKSVNDAAALFELRIKKALFVYLSLWDFALGKSDLLVEGLRKRNCHLKTEVNAPADLATIKALQSTGQVESEYLLSDGVLAILHHFLSLLLACPQLLAVNQAIEQYSKQLLRILLVHVLVKPFGLAHPAEKGFGRKVFFRVFEIFFEDEVDFSHFAVVYVSVEDQSIV